MKHTLLRTGTYTPREGDEGEFRTQFYPDGSAVIVHERGITFVRKSGWSGFERRFPCSYLANRLGMGIIIGQARRSGRYQNFIGAAAKQENVSMVVIRHH
jgi:hypothetical protein